MLFGHRFIITSSWKDGKSEKCAGCKKIIENQGQAYKCKFPKIDTPQNRRWKRVK